MNEPYAQRMARAVEEADRHGLAGLVVTPSPDLRYLTGYDPPPLERLTALILGPGRDPVLLVPELEAPLAGSLPAGDLVTLATWRDGEDPHEAAGRLLVGEGTYGATDRMWATHLLGLQRAVPDARFVAASATLGRLRAVKDRQELELLGRAARAADQAFGQILGARFAGTPEEGVSAHLAALLVEAGHERSDFAIVASGANGASPHHEPGGRSIRAGDAVVMDFGGQLLGYFSDITRTVCVGEATAEVEEVHAIVREAQEQAFLAVAPGVAAHDVDRAARQVIEQAGYGDRFIHRTGHGIGLEVHEPPYIVEGNAEPLAEGMCFSIEPGIYLEGRFGVRIEDIVTVTAEGGRRLNHAPRDLAVVA